MRKATGVIFTLVLLLAGFAPALAAEQDVKGSKDHPLLTRMPDFFVAEYKETEFDSHKFIGADKKPVSIEGHKYSLVYRLQKGAAEPGELKIRRNIQDALKKIGGKVIFDENFNRRSTIVLQKDNKETWIDVNSSAAYYRLWIVEREVMRQEVVANAEAMGNDLDATGHVSIYGIYFDTGRAEIKPESEAALAEIAKLLANDTGLKLYVVGHTDNVGSFEANLKLSRERAEAVVKALAGKPGIEAARLKPQGVSSLAPVASNDSEEGKAKNRRVELVKQ